MRHMSRLLFLSLLLIGSLAVTPMAQAAIISVDDLVFGAGALTRNTDQGLDFLDLTLSTNRSFNDVMGQFGVGGDFESFRHATETEVISLINNFGFSPGAVAGSFVTGDTGSDQLSGLASLVGVTLFAPGLDPENRTTGFTGTFPMLGNARLEVLQDRIDGNIDDAVGANVIGSTVASQVETGHWLVRDSSLTPIPTPSAMLLMGTGLAGLMGWRWWTKTA